MKISVASEKGLREFQEDVYLFEQLKDGVLVGVFDGHGGDRTAKMAAKLFREIFPAKLKRVPGEPDVALVSTFKFVVEATRKNSDGSTASVAYVADNRAYIVTIGDSPVIVKDAAGVLHESEEHNVRSNPVEASAAKARGGFLRGGYLYSATSWQGLQMSRALGDADLDKVLSREPGVYSEPLGPDSWVLLATDGVFDPAHEGAYGPRDAAEQISAQLITAQVIVNDAVNRRTGDNATAVLVRVGD